MLNTTMNKAQFVADKFLPLTFGFVDCSAEDEHVKMIEVEKALGNVKQNAFALKTTLHPDRGFYIQSYVLADYHPDRGTFETPADMKNDTLSRCLTGTAKTLFDINLTSADRATDCLLADIATSIISFYLSAQEYRFFTSHLHQHSPEIVERLKSYDFANKIANPASAEQIADCLIDCIDRNFFETLLTKHTLDQLERLTDSVKRIAIEHRLQVLA